MIKYKRFFTVTNFAVALTLLVVMLGAYTRLTDAGLGCPDWPGCYGHLVVKEPTGEIVKHFPITSFYAVKAWTEMIHRYAAGCLALLIFGIFVAAIRLYSDPFAPKTVPFTLAALVIFQALLGMWTVTLKLSPQVVTLHLLCGFSVLALLWCLRLQLRRSYESVIDNFAVRARTFAFVGLLLLIFQIFLGAWTSTNYAALSCGNDFPKCNGLWHIPVGFTQIMALTQPLGPDYTGGLLDLNIRMGIQMLHRLFAGITGVYLLFLSMAFIFKSIQLRRVGMVILLLVMSQIGLGVANVIYLLPLEVAVFHNFVAALLLLAVVTLFYATCQARTRLNV